MTTSRRSISQVAVGTRSFRPCFTKIYSRRRNRDPQAALLLVLTITSQPAKDKPAFPGEAIFKPAQERNSPLVAALIDRGIDLSAKNQDGNTALHVAAAEVDNAVIATKLLQAGSDINAIDNGGATPLHYAASSADKEMVQVLLDWEADITVKDTGEKLALHWAAENRQLDVSRLLLDQGADIRAKDGSGRTALQLAENGGYDDLVEFLQDEMEIDSRAVQSTLGETEAPQVGELALPSISETN